MTKIRENLATFFSIFAGLFVVYIVLDWGMDITGRRHSSRQAEAQQVGQIDGEPILFKDYSDLVRRAIENQRAQNGTEPDDDQQRMIRDQIWNQLVEQQLYGEEAQRMGISVTDDELRDYLYGDNPPDALRRLFTDSTGQFHRDAYEQFLQNPNQFIKDPQGKDPNYGVTQLADYERDLRRQLERQKLQSIVMASVHVDPADVRQRFMDQNIKYEANYIFFDPNALVKDNQITLTDDELRRYYNEHSDEYKVEASRRLKYVMFTEAPSKADTDDVVATLDDVAKRAKDGADFADLAKTFSEVPPNDTIYHKHGEFSPDREAAIFGAKVGEVIGPIKDYDGYHLIKVLEFRPGKDEFVRASHILIRIENNDSTKALKDAKDVLAQAKHGEDFAALAAKYSKDPGSAAKGGDLGWFGKGRMVKPFEEAAFKAKPGQIVGPVRSTFGYHIIKVTEKDNREVRISDIVLPVHVSPQTRSDVSQHAQDFAYLAKQGSFEKEAADDKYKVQETPSFQNNATVPGIGVNQAVSKFAFGNRVGAISEAMQVQNGYAVFMVSEAKDAGIQPFDEVKSTIQNQLRHEKKMEKVKSMAQELRQPLAPNDSLGMITEKNPQLSVQHLAPFTLSGYIPGIGRDPGFAGGISTLAVNKISQPIETTRGVYLIKLLNKTPFDTTAFNSQRESLRLQLLNEKRNRYFSEWSTQLKKTADIVDNRDMFYR